ncbi:condensation domain-containing protein [Leisingera daeponensis]|uniref:condensation domain-containing protein n=1 Tax=Leisingera daeponensis TaxID=405746 RepID=UPI00041015A7|nr:condensation domain-containing protein [Leisingera daeponensis]
MNVGATATQGLIGVAPRRVSDYPRTNRVSYNQEQICLLEAFYPNNKAYNFQATIEIEGALELSVLEQAISAVIARHEMLRTTIELGTEGFVAKINAPYAFEVAHIDLRDTTPEAVEAAFEGILKARLETTFDVSRPPLFTITAVQMAEANWRLIQVEHHVIHDGWSLGRLWSEIEAAYNAILANVQLELHDIPAQYQQFVAWQRDQIEGDYGKAALAFWHGYLDGSDFEVSLRAERPEGSNLAGLNIDTYLDAAFYKSLSAAARKCAVSEYVLMFSVFSRLVGDLTGSQDFCVGTAVSARSEQDIDPMIGMVVNTVPVRVLLEAGATETLRSVQKSFFKAIRYHDVPLSLLVRTLNIRQKKGSNPIFQHCFSFHDSTVPKLRFGEAAGVIHERQNRTSKFDVNVVVTPPSKIRKVAECRISWQFSETLFDANQARTFAEAFCALLSDWINEIACPAQPVISQEPQVAHL